MPGRRLLGRSAALAAGILLAACTPLPPTTTATPQASTDTTTSPETPQATAAPDAVETARTPPADVAKPSYPAPDQLTDLDEPQVRQIFGDPGFVRRDPPAEIWQYRTDGCVLYMFFYDDSSGLALRYLEARRPGGAKLATDACIQQVIDARQRHAQAG